MKTTQNEGECLPFEEIISALQYGKYFHSFILNKEGNLKGIRGFLEPGADTSKMEDLIVRSLMVLLLLEVTVSNTCDLNNPWWSHTFEATISTGFSIWIVKMYRKTVSQLQYLLSHIKCCNVLLLLLRYFLCIKPWDFNFIESESPYTPLYKKHIESSMLLCIWPMWAHGIYLINTLTLHNLITNRTFFHNQFKIVFSTIASIWLSS